MALSNVEQAVLQKAEAEARTLGDEAAADAKAREERETARLREEHQRRVEALRQKLESALDQEVSARESEAGMKALAIKNEIIEDVFSQAVQGILNLPGDGYAKWLERQIGQLPDLPQATLAANRKDREPLRQAAQNAGKPQIKIADDDADITGGFLVRGGQSDLDFSVEALMDSLRESLTQDVATRLFGEGEA